MNQNDAVISAQEMQDRLQLSRGQFQYFLKRFGDRLPPATRIGLVRFWREDSVERFLEVCAEAERLGALRRA